MSSQPYILSSYPHIQISLLVAMCSNLSYHLSNKISATANIGVKVLWVCSRPILIVNEEPQLVRKGNA